MKEWFSSRSAEITGARGIGPKVLQDNMPVEFDREGAREDDGWKAGSQVGGTGKFQGSVRLYEG